MKFVCIDLCESTKILHTEIINEQIKIHSKTTVDMSQYINGNEILNIFETVTSIVNHLKLSGIKNKNILLSCPNVNYEIKNYLKANSLKSDIDLGKILKNDNKNTEYVVSSLEFGKCFYENEYRNFSLDISILRETSEKLSKAFKKYGYNLITITSKVSALTAFSKIMDESFDSSYKVIIDALSYPPKSYFLSNDVLIKENVWRDSPSDNVSEYIVEKIKNELNLYRIKNPKIHILVNGDYEEVLIKLRQNTFDVYDLKERIDFDDFDASYGVALGLALQKFYKIKSNLKTKNKHELSNKQLNILSRCSLAFASAFFVLSASMLVKNYVGISDVDSINSENLSLQSEISYNQNAQTLLQEELELLKLTQDNNILKQITSLSLQSEDIFIASIDTTEMLASIQVETDLELDTEVVIPANNYIIRGYSQNASSISVFSDNLPFDNVKLNGIQKINDLDFYAFEIEVVK